MAESLIPVREIGDSGIGVSILGLGTVKIGRNKNVKNKSPDGFKLPEDAEVLNLLDICIEHGVNLLEAFHQKHLKEGFVEPEDHEIDSLRLKMTE